LRHDVLGVLWSRTGLHLIIAFKAPANGTLNQFYILNGRIPVVLL